MDQWTARIAKDWKKPCEPKLAAQKKRLAELDALAEACRDLVKDVDLVCKLPSGWWTPRKRTPVRATTMTGMAAPSGGWKRTRARAQRCCRTTQAHGLLPAPGPLAAVAFSGGEIRSRSRPVPLVTRAEIEAADWSLTPGRYVGVAPPEVDEDFDFEQTLRDIHVELADLNQEAVRSGGEDSGES